MRKLWRLSTQDGGGGSVLKRSSGLWRRVIAVAILFLSLLAATDFFLVNCSDGDAWRDRALLERLTPKMANTGLLRL
ncbi:hypothetical protein CQ10_42360 [Bradyrhizobium valentinum]|nr:hypothetical protein CQ10_42360 [Bradyrhizobium valentinum]